MLETVNKTSLFTFTSPIVTMLSSSEENSPVKQPETESGRGETNLKSLCLREDFAKVENSHAGFPRSCSSPPEMHMATAAYSPHSVPVRCCVCEEVLQKPVQFKVPESSSHLVIFVLRQPKPACWVCNKCWDMFYCLNKSLGCGWRGPKLSAQDHASACQYKRWPCANPGCNVIVTNATQETHAKECLFQLRTCPHCGEEHQSSKFDNHVEACLETLIECPNCCSEIPRKRLEFHLKVCKEKRAENGNPEAVTPHVIRFSVTYEYAVDPPHSVRCCACKEVLRNPVQIMCGERCCEECYKGLLRLPKPSCPLCNSPIRRKECWRDVFAVKEIDQLEVYCLNKFHGCGWRGPKSSAQDHASACQYKRWPFANPGCNVIVTNATQETHAKECLFQLRTCPHCGEEHQSSKFDNHLEACLETLIECRNCCSEIPRKRLESHLEVCKEKRDDNGNPESLTPHLIAATSKGHETLKREVSRLQENLTETRHDFRTLQQSNTKGIEILTERISSLETQATDIQAHQKVVQTKLLEACYQSVDNAQKDYTAKFGNIENHLRMMTEKMLKMEETITSQASRIRTLEEENSSLKRNGLPSTSGIGLGGSGLTPLIEQQFSQQDRILATHDIQLAEHGLRIDMLDCKNTEGVLLWKITDVRRLCREAVSGKTPSIYSQPFYTSGGGYKLCARLYLNGDGMGKGTHLSLFFVVMRGEYDALLPWPFQQKVSLVLMDQQYARHVSVTFRPDPTSSSFKKPRNEMNIASGCPLFVSLAILDSGCYIKDDTMFVKVVVDTSDVVRPDSKR